MRCRLIVIALLSTGISTFAQTGICYVDGTTHTTLAAAVSCAGSSGTIEVTPAVGTLSVPANITVPAGVTLRVDQGAILSIASGVTLTISGPLVDGLYQMFDGQVSFTLPGNQAISRPEWWGAKADGSQTVPISGTDNLAAFNAALAALPPYYLPTQGTYSLQNGQLAKSGTLLLSQGRYVISNTLQWSPFVSYECPSYRGCMIALKDGVATSGETWVIKVQAIVSSGNPVANITYGAQFKNIYVDCNGGFFFGTNVASSGVMFYGAQGSLLGTLWIENCGVRGLWLPYQTSINGPSDVEVIGVTTGPGIQLDAGAAVLSTVRVEHVNEAGSNKDADGDPNPGLLIGSALSNGSININIGLLGIESDGLPVKIWGGAGIVIGNISSLTTSGGQSNLAIISHGAISVSFGPMFTFSARPNVFTNFITDRTTSPATTVSGSFSDYPSIQGYKTIH